MKFLHIIPSRDRASQLEAQLRTLHYLKGDINTIILYTFSSPEHEESYKEVIQMYPKTTFIKEKNFKTDFEDIIFKSSCEYVFVTPDDGCFLRDVYLSQIENILKNKTMIYSIRLGRNTTICHPMGNKKGSSPDFESVNVDYLSWTWGVGELDWGYPLALDGSIFSRSVFLTMLRQIVYTKPTSLEVSLQKFNQAFSIWKGVCNEQSQFVSIPWNAVTDEASNLNGEIEIDLFLKKWKDGYRINISSIIDSTPPSCHYEYELSWEKRP